ncbi:putative nucleolar protein 5-2 [Cardamine amara subsp. amara]|uniref:Nucleolar protein 5-2 n=1 Tax=Cardamine amara subsp. amara TaxID=228776 RepID=A0ABD0ZZZ1_CARAN
MMMLVETPDRFFLFKVLDEDKVCNLKDLAEAFKSPALARKVVELKQSMIFQDTSAALHAATRLVKGVPTDGLCDFLKDHCEIDSLGVADARFGNSIFETLNITCLSTRLVMELIKTVKSQFQAFSEINVAHIRSCLSHSFARHNMLFNPDKV